MTVRPLLFFHIVTTEARKLMSYRADFWLSSIVGLVAGIVIPYFLWSAIFEESGKTQIGEYTFEAMLTYYVIVVLVGRLVQGPDLMTGLANDVYQGELSRYLVYPLRYLPFKYAQHLGASFPGVIQLAVFGTAFTLFLTPPDELTITPGSALRCALSILLGNLLYFLMTFPLQAVAFWADNVWSLIVLLRFVCSFFGGLFIPLTLFPAEAANVLHFTPFPYLYSFPVRTLIGAVSPLEWLTGVGVCLLWSLGVLAVGRGVWRRGELEYSGVGI